MARWKLITAHYLLTLDKTEWEYTENDRKTGRPKRMKFEVPRYISPLDPADWTNRWGTKDDSDGEVIVCYPGKGTESDIEFLGEPTPDMMPIDDEAKAISATFEPRWAYKPETAEGSYSQSLVDQFQEGMAAVQSVAKQEVTIAGLDTLIAAIAKQAEATNALLSGSIKRI
jgi:hypothetical protein